MPLFPGAMIMSLSIKVAAVLVLCGFATPSTAGPFEDGLDAARRADYAAVLRLWAPLAEQGDARAQANLGLLYSNGRGVSQDYVSAYMWFDLAAAGGNEEAEKRRDTMAKKMTSGQIAQAQKLADEWKRK
jgi:TPR repeat protein